jgi:hypothetical protein
MNHAENPDIFKIHLDPAANLGLVSERNQSKENEYRDSKQITRKLGFGIYCIYTGPLHRQFPECVHLPHPGIEIHRITGINLHVLQSADPFL